MIESLQARILKTLFVLVWIIALIHMTAEYYHLYWTVRWFDIPTHFLGGVWVGIASIWFWYFSGYIHEVHMPTKRAFFIALLGGLLIGLVWELFEYIVWFLTGEGLPPNYVHDTLLDLVMDVLGSIVGFFAIKHFLFKDSQ